MKVLLNAKNTVIAIIAVIAIGTSFPIYSKAEEGETQILEPKTSGDEVFQEGVASGKCGFTTLRSLPRLITRF